MPRDGKGLGDQPTKPAKPSEVPETTDPTTEFLTEGSAANPAKIAQPDIPPSPQPSTFDWTRHDVETLLTTVRGRIEYWRERASPEIRPRIEKLTAEFDPCIAGLLAKGDFDSLRYCLIDLQRQVGDALSGHGWK